MICLATFSALLILLSSVNAKSFIALRSSLAASGNQPESGAKNIFKFENVPNALTVARVGAVPLLVVFSTLHRVSLFSKGN